MRALLALWQREPARLVGLVAQLVALAVAFGLHVTDAQRAAINATILLIVIEVVRSQVNPKGPPSDAPPASPKP